MQFICIQISGLLSFSGKELNNIFHWASWAGLKWSLGWPVAAGESEHELPTLGISEDLRRSFCLPVNHVNLGNNYCMNISVMDWNSKVFRKLSGLLFLEMLASFWAGDYLKKLQKTIVDSSFGQVGLRDKFCLIWRNKAKRWFLHPFMV